LQTQTDIKLQAGEFLSGLLDSDPSEPKLPFPAVQYCI